MKLLSSVHSLSTVLVPYAEDLNELSDSLLEQLNARSTHGHPFHKIDNPHISLTRTLKLRHHWLNDLSLSLESMAALFRRSDFNCSTRAVCSIHTAYLRLMLCSIHTVHLCLMLCVGFPGHCYQTWTCLLSGTCTAYLPALHFIALSLVC